MTNKILAAALAVATALVGGAASAQDAGAPRDPMSRFDANGDGVITRDEMMADAAARFAKMDTNNDGTVDQAERDAARAAMGGRGFGGRMGGDGAMTLDAVKAQAAQRFDRIDTNHDGKIDQAERAAMRDRMMAMRGRRGGDAPASPPAGAPGNE